MQFNRSRKIITQFVYMKYHFYKLCLILVELSLMNLHVAPCINSIKNTIYYSN